MRRASSSAVTSFAKEHVGSASAFSDERRAFGTVCGDETDATVGGGQGGVRLSSNEAEDSDGDKHSKDEGGDTKSGDSDLSVTCKGGESVEDNDEVVDATVRIGSDSVRLRDVSRQSTFV